jgi:hypothetical protein
MTMPTTSPRRLLSLVAAALTIATLASSVLALPGLGTSALAAPDDDPSLPARQRLTPSAPTDRSADTLPQARQPAADLVVDFDDGRVAVSRHVLDTPVTGMDLLKASGLEITRSGGAICAIEGRGCPADDCFCYPDRFWAYFHLGADGSWTFSQEGAADHDVGAGDVEGWVWSGSRQPVTSTSQTRAAALGALWLLDQVRGDGSIGSHAGLTSDAVLSAVAAGDSFSPGGSAAAMLAYLRRHASTYSALGAAAAGKLSTVASAAGQRPSAFGGVDLVARIRASYDPATGWFGASTWDQAWAILGLAAARSQVPPAAVSALASAATSDGGWGVAPGSEPEADSTALALQALIAAGAPVTGTAVSAALDFLEATQHSDGGWGHGGPSNTNSTALALQALVAAGHDPTEQRWTQATGADPVSYLIEAQLPSGAFEFDVSPADLVATGQAVPALAGRTLVVRGLRPAIEAAARWTWAQQAPEGSFEGFGVGATIDAVLALTAVGEDPAARGPAGGSAVQALAAAAADYVARGPAASGKLATGVVALGRDPHSFGGIDVIAAITNTYSADGSFGEGKPWDNAWAILGLAAAREPIPAAAAKHLMDISAADGGWGFDPSADESDVDSTGLVLQALAAAGADADNAAVRSGVDALRRSQLASGLFPGFGGSPSAASTAMAIGGLVAAGQHVDGPGWLPREPDWLAALPPLTALAHIQSREGGFPGYQGENDPGATYQALLGLSGRPLPVARLVTFLPLTVVRSQ